MHVVKLTSWQDGEFYIGFLNDDPDYLTQDLSKAELVDNLKSLLNDLETEEIPYARKVEELQVARRVFSTPFHSITYPNPRRV